MSDLMVNTKDVILRLKKVKQEKKLSLDKIIKLMEQNNEYVSKTTLSRVFAKGSEEQIFRYEATLRPIANALLDIETIETYDDPNTQAMKSILKLKKDLIDELKGELKGYEELKSQVEHQQKTIDLLNEQIAYKDARIDKLLDTNERQSVTIERITERLMTCPCRE